MKTIKMDYSEYEEMVELIKTQQDTIEEFKKQPNVVLVDERYNYGCGNRNWYSGRIPKVVSDTEKAKEMMKEEFDHLFKETRELEEQIIRLQQPKQKVKKKGWWW